MDPSGAVDGKIDGAQCARDQWASREALGNASLPSLRTTGQSSTHRMASLTEEFGRCRGDSFTQMAVGGTVWFQAHAALLSLLLSCRGTDSVGTVWFQALSVGEGQRSWPSS